MCMLVSTGDETLCWTVVFFLPSCVGWSLDKEERDRDALISVLVLCCETVPMFAL